MGDSVERSCEYLAVNLSSWHCVTVCGGGCEVSASVGTEGARLLHCSCAVMCPPEHPGAPEHSPQQQLPSYFHLQPPAPTNHQPPSSSSAWASLKQTPSTLSSTQPSLGRSPPQTSSSTLCTRPGDPPRPPLQSSNSNTRLLPNEALTASGAHSTIAPLRRLACPLATIL